MQFKNTGRKTEFVLADIEKVEGISPLESDCFFYFSLVPS